MVLFASAKMVGGAITPSSNSYLITVLMFRGAFPYPVIK